MPEFLSSGLNGEVYYATPEDQKLFPQSDLVKISYFLSRDDMILSWYRQKIAEILVPSIIPHSTATTNAHDALINNGLIKQRNNHFKKDYPAKIYSKFITVHPDHALFSTHSKYIRRLEDGDPWKDLECEDERCIEHQRLHSTDKWNSKVQTAEQEYKQFGIKVNKYDFSDWCITAQGDIIFFEIESIDWDLLSDYLQARRQPTQNQRRAYALLLRYEDLYYKDRLSIKPERKPELKFSIRNLLSYRVKNTLYRRV